MITIARHVRADGAGMTDEGGAFLMKRKNYIFRRYCIFFTGLFFVAFGIAFVTKAGLGTSAISSVPYTLSLIWPALTMGQWTILFNYLLVAAQIVILKGRVSKIEMLLQLGVTLIFGYCIDFGMWILTSLEPQNYGTKLAALGIGILIMSFGAYLEFVGNVVMLPGDGFANTIARVSHRSFGFIRFISDTIMVACAALMCIFCLHALTGVREGTVIAALTVGNVVRIYTRLFRGAEERILPAE